MFRGDAKLAHSAVWLGCVCGRTGLLFCGDAELAHSAIWLGVVVEGRDFCFEETPNWRIARFGWGWLWKDGTFVLGDAELAHSAIPLGVVVSLWVE